MRMTYAQWMKDTAAFGRSRSKELKAVDEAFKKYELALEKSTGSVLNERRALTSALQAWKDAQKAKGQDWRTSVRNSKKTVELLDAELGAVARLPQYCSTPLLRSGICSSAASSAPCSSSV